LPEQGIDRQAQRYREQRDTHGVERWPVRIIRLGNPSRHGEGQQKAKGDIGVEDPTPAEPRGEQTAQGRAQSHGDTGNDPDDAERPCPPTKIGKCTGDERDCARDHKGGPDALYDP
jgi:hypothetical protein